MARRSTGDSDEEPRSTVRWDPDVYAAALGASSLTGTSFNTLANKAMANYLSTPEFASKLEAAQEQARKAIAKLSGESEP